MRTIHQSSLRASRHYSKSLEGSSESTESLYRQAKKALAVAAGDFMYLKVSPMRGVHWFGVHGKLAPRYVGP